MGMKFACRHLLCRKDLSCTKVNAVNRLRDGLEASFRLARRGGSSSGSQSSTPYAGARAQLSADGVLGEPVAGQVGQNKETQLCRLVSVLSK